MGSLWIGFLEHRRIITHNFCFSLIGRLILGPSYAKLLYAKNELSATTTSGSGAANPLKHTDLSYESKSHIVVGVVNSKLVSAIENFLELVLEEVQDCKGDGWEVEETVAAGNSAIIILAILEELTIDMCTHLDIRYFELIVDIILDKLSSPVLVGSAGKASLHPLSRNIIKAMLSYLQKLVHKNEIITNKLSERHIIQIGECVGDLKKTLNINEEYLHTRCGVIIASLDSTSAVEYMIKSSNVSHCVSDNVHILRESVSRIKDKLVAATPTDLIDYPRTLAFNFM